MDKDDQDQWEDPNVCRQDRVLVKFKGDTEDAGVQILPRVKALKLKKGDRVRSAVNAYKNRAGGCAAMGRVLY